MLVPKETAYSFADSALSYLLNGLLIYVEKKD